MSKVTKNKIVPKLRFPEFKNSGEWKETTLNHNVNYENGKAHENDISASGKYIVVNSRFISSDGDVRKFTNSGFCLANKGDILMVLSDVPNGKAIARCFYIDFENTYTVNQRICKLKPKEADGLFLYYILDRSSYFLAFDDGVKQTNLKKDDVLNCPIILPKDPSEQQKIASCLSSLDELISAQSQKLEGLKTHKKGLMQQLFPAEGKKTPKLRFKEFKSTSAWKEISLINVANRKVKWSFTGGPFGSNLKASDYVPTGIRIIQLQNIGDGEFIDDYKIFTSEEKANELMSCNIYPGDIILSKMGDPVGRACLIPNTTARYVMCSDGIRLAVDEQQYSKYFIFTLINSTQFRALVEKTATGSTRKRIGLEELKNLPLMVPNSREEQQKIASCLSSLDELITAQAEKIEVLKTHKKGLMQQLFPNPTGSNL